MPLHVGAMIAADMELEEQSPDRQCLDPADAPAASDRFSPGATLINSPS